LITADGVWLFIILICVAFSSEFGWHCSLTRFS
jgi:hypothetical protein